MDDLGFVPNTEAASAAPERAPASTDDLGFVPDVKKPEAQAAEEDLGFVPTESKYGTLGQSAIGLAEQAAMGALGPAEALVPYAETRLGLTTPEAIKGREKELGLLAPVAQMAGFALGPGKAVSVLGKGAAGAAKAIGVGEKLAKSAGLGAELAALSGGHELTKKVLQDPEATAANAAFNIMANMIFGTALGYAFRKGIEPLWEKQVAPVIESALQKVKSHWKLGEAGTKDGQVLGPVMRTVLTKYFGADPKAIDAYIAQREAIMAAPTTMEVYDHALDQVANVAENLATKKANVKESSEKLSGFIKDQVQALKEKGFEAGEAAKTAKAALDQAQMRIADSIQNDAIEKAPVIHSAIEKLKSQVFDASATSREVLDKVPGMFSLIPLYREIPKMADELFQKGQSAQAENLLTFAREYRERWGNEIPYPQVKNLIQGLQQRGKWDALANEVIKGTSPYYNELSFLVNDSLKEAVPAYRRAMEPTAKLTELLKNKAFRKYGTPESALKSVLNIKKTGNYLTEMPVLRELEKTTGFQFIDDIEKFANKETAEEMAKVLPEFKKYQEAAAFLHSLKDPETKAAMEQMAQLPSEARTELKFDLAELEKAEARAEKFKGIREAGLQAKLEAAKRGKNVYLEKQLKEMRGMEVPGFGTLDLPTILKLIHYREAFEKGATHGSRNVNLFSNMLGGFANLIGHATGAGIGAGVLGGPMFAPLGIAIGAGIGAIVDKEGPAIAKRYLDSILDRHPELIKATGISEKQAKEALIHFLSNPEAPANAKAFKSTVDYLDSVKKGDSLLKKSSKAIFEGTKVLPKDIKLKDEDVNDLDEKAKKFPKSGMLEDFGGQFGTYMPEHGRAMAQIASTMATAINDHRPKPQGGAFYDTEIEPTKEQKYAYRNALKIAQQPLVLLEKVQSGTLTPDDVQILQKTNPFAYRQMKEAVTDAMLEHKANEGKVPYKMRQSLSLFIGQDLDGSLNQQSLAAVQAIFAKQKQAMMMPPAGTKMKGLEKASKSYLTTEQARSQRQKEPIS